MRGFAVVVDVDGCHVGGGTGGCGRPVHSGIVMIGPGWQLARVVVTIGDTE
jgi:hypothetical protein